jgi:transcriptional regulator with XRE-family HTH domain
MDSTQRRFITNFKQLREQKGWTQAALAEEAGLSWGYIARLEIGRHDPSLSTLAKLAKALKVKVEELVQ